MGLGILVLADSEVGLMARLVDLTDRHARRSVQMREAKNTGGIQDSQNPRHELREMTRVGCAAKDYGEGELGSRGVTLLLGV